MEERLQKVIAAAGIASRRKAEELILAGRVKVNGETVRTLGTKVSSRDTVEVDGKLLQKEEKVFWLMNKPLHTVCTRKDDRSRQTVLDLMDVKERVYPVGRLDYDTTGVLLLTNDGDFANRMMHPRNHLPKTYEAAIEGLIQDEQAEQLSRGIELEDGMTLPAEVKIILRNPDKNKSVLQITIFEGRNREVRRMMEHFGFRITRLERVRYGNLDAGKLRRGEYRRLKKHEIDALLQLSADGGIVPGSGSM
ncbi:MAG: rRNA pseudouridine synthase [Erysipelotrichaceae bacterium]|nr:rRNA pseudouridine synthase [Erysipelotrichaceae bacterium]